MSSMLIQSSIQKAVAEQSTASDLNEKFDALFPTWTTIVATILAVLILLIILTKLLYKPVKKMHDDRKNYIQTNIDSAEAQKADAISDREKANNELIQARSEAAEIINKAKIEADEVKADKIAAAKLQAKQVIDNAKDNMAAQQAKFENESQEAIVEVALAAASKVIEKDVDNKVNRKIVNDYVKANK